MRDLLAPELLVVLLLLVGAMWCASGNIVEADTWVPIAEQP